MSSPKRSLLRILLTVNRGCGCGSPKPTDVYEPTPIIPKSSIYQNPNPSSLTSSTTSGERNDDGDFTSATISEAETDHNKSSKAKSNMNMMPKQSPKLMDSVAVEKDSHDPYKDFRHSMLQMIFEQEIYSEEDLEELLECFLQLNSPCQHEVIVKAFREICEEAFPKEVVSSGRKPLARVKGM